MSESGLTRGRGNATASLENYTFLTSDMALKRTNVYEGWRGQITKGFSNAKKAIFFRGFGMALGNQGFFEGDQKRIFQTFSLAFASAV